MLGRQPVLRDALTEHDEGRIPEIDDGEHHQSRTESCSRRGLLRYADLRHPTPRKQVTQEDEYALLQPRRYGDNRSSAMH